MVYWSAIKTQFPNSGKPKVVQAVDREIYVARDNGQEARRNG